MGASAPFFWPIESRGNRHRGHSDAGLGRPSPRLLAQCRAANPLLPWRSRAEHAGRASLRRVGRCVDERPQPGTSVEAGQAAAGSAFPEHASRRLVCHHTASCKPEDARPMAQSTGGGQTRAQGRGSRRAYSSSASRTSRAGPRGRSRGRPRRARLALPSRRPQSCFPQHAPRPQREALQNWRAATAA